MELYLLRHANADTEAAHDDDRALSEKGRGQAAKVAKFCREHDLQPDVLLSSPIRRAQETAEIVAETLGVEMKIARWLACGLEPAKALTHLRELQTHERVMLVGHEPDFSELAAHLLGLPDGVQIRIRKASLTRIDLAALTPGTGCLQYSIPCRYL
jgi:phosphohistidine phosphatase